MLEIKNLNFKYSKGEFTLVGISLSLKKGEILGVMGPSGSGKTTLVYILSGIIPSFIKGDLSGEIKIFNKRISEISPFKDKITLIMQNPYTQLSGIKSTVFEEIAFPLENKGLEKEKIIQKVNEILKKLEIEHLKNKNVFELSGGETQKVTIATGLVIEPELIIMDEISTLLDFWSTEKIYNIIREYIKKNKKIGIIIENSISHIFEYTDYSLILNNGRQVFWGPTSLLIKERKNLEKWGIEPFLFSSSYKKLKQKILEKIGKWELL